MVFGDMIYLYCRFEKMIKKVAWILFFALLAISCLDEPDCYNLNNNIFGIAFRKMADNKADTVTLIGISINGTDSIFYEYSLATGVELPLNFLADQSEIIFQRLDHAGAVTNRLLLAYRSQIQFVSEDCGERFLIADVNPVESDFDSVRVVNRSPGNTATTNLIVYRCPTTDLIRFGFRQLHADEDSVGVPLDIGVDSISADYTSTVFFPDDTASSFVLPLNPAANSTRFDFDLVSGSGFVALNYETTNEARFTVCGQQTFFAGLTILSTDFDITRVVNDSIEDPPVTNVLLLRCPDTNLVTIAFKDQPGEDAPDVTVPLIGITADYTTEVFYPNTSAATVILPLNAQADMTRFSIAFEDEVIDIELGYDRNEVVYHNVCNRTAMSSLEVISSGFATPPQILNDEIVSPTNGSNVAMIID